MDTFFSKVWTKIKSVTYSIWSNDKVLFTIFLPIILVVKFRTMLISLLIGNAKNIQKDTLKKSDSIEKKIENTNKQADDLVNKAAGLSKQSNVVSEDWYEKSK